MVQKYGLGLVLANGDIDSVAAGALTSVKWLRNANWGPGHFQGMNALIDRPGAASAADFVRYASTLTPSTGVLAPDANWADTTLGTEYMRILYHGLHPQHVMDAAQRGLRRCSFQNQIYVSLAADADMQSTGVTDWVESDVDGGPATGFTKITTAANVFTGIRAGRLLNTAANGYVRQRFNVRQSSTIFVATVVRADVGTFSLTLWDVTNDEEIGTAITTEEETWQYVWRQEPIPATCEILEVRLQGVGATDDIYLDGLWVHNPNSLRINLPSTIDKAFEFEALSYARFSEGTANGVADAASIRTVEVPRSAFTPNFLAAEANPSFIQFHERGWLGHPLILQGRRPHSDLITLAAETDDVDIDLELWAAATALELFEVKSDIPDAFALAARAERDFAAYRLNRATEGPAERQEPYAYRTVNY